MSIAQWLFGAPKPSEKVKEAEATLKPGRDRRERALDRLMTQIAKDAEEIGDAVRDSIHGGKPR